MLGPLQETHLLYVAWLHSGMDIILADDEPDLTAALTLSAAAILQLAPAPAAALTAQMEPTLHGWARRFEQADWTYIDARTRLSQHHLAPVAARLAPYAYHLNESTVLARAPAAFLAAQVPCQMGDIERVLALAQQGYAYRAGYINGWLDQHVNGGEGPCRGCGRVLALAHLADAQRGLCGRCCDA